MKDIRLSLIQIVDDEPRADSRKLCGRLGIDHKSFVNNIVRKYRLDFEEFGVLSFQNTKPQQQGGRPQVYSLLNEQQCNLALTYVRNTAEARKLKIDLIKQFAIYKEQAQAPSTAQLVNLYTFRMLANQDRVTKGYFSVIGEANRMNIKFAIAGEPLPDYHASDKAEIRIDVSIGQGFSKYLKIKYPDMDFTDTCYRYFHVLPSGWEVKARQYPMHILPLFIHYMEDVWLPKQAPRYLKSRAPKALEVLPKMLRG